jgi:type IV pilus assembly protein PilW
MKVMRSEAVCKRHALSQRGLTIVELMISMAIGLFVVLAATALLVSAKTSYVTEEEEMRLQDNGRYAIEIMSRAVRQASYENWDKIDAPVLAGDILSANLGGLDASGLKATSSGIDSPNGKAVNGSDVLVVRFFGAGAGANGDGSIVNCAGFGVAAATSQATADKDRGWSVFYVAESSNGQPELYCKYVGNSKWAAQAIASGVESFQVIYGLDTDGDGLANRFVTATELNTLDNALVLEGDTAKKKAEDKNRKTNWKKVVVVRLALLVRGTRNASADKAEMEFHLFGKDYAAAKGGSDSGTTIKESGFPKELRNRTRRLFGATVQIRNQSLGGGV